MCMWHVNHPSLERKCCFAADLQVFWVSTTVTAIASKNWVNSSIGLVKSSVSIGEFIQILNISTETSHLQTQIFLLLKLYIWDIFILLVSVRVNLPQLVKTVGFWLMFQARASLRHTLPSTGTERKPLLRRSVWKHPKTTGSLVSVMVNLLCSFMMGLLWFIMVHC